MAYSIVDGPLPFADYYADFAQALWDFRPEIILADYRLPNFDGGQALAMARENCPMEFLIFAIMKN